MKKSEVFNAAKEKGYIGENILSLVEDWLRKDKQIHCEIFFSMFHKKWSINNYFIDMNKLKKIDHGCKTTYFETYEEVQVFSISEMLKKV